MSTLKNNEYIVFQPDQVLTNDHLNQLFYYLDRQNRLTRNKLIGMGIVCGFELVATLLNKGTLSTIEIKKGCGLSSEGYLLVDCTDHIYTHAILYTPPTLPADLPFSCKTIPFYNYPLQTQGINTAIYTLMTCEQYQARVAAGNSAAPDSPCGQTSPSSPVTADSPPNSPPGSPVQAQPFPLSTPPPGTNLFEYAVVLFLEASEKDLKNCDMQDCDNKGEKMVFTIRPLLVPKRYLPNFCGEKGKQRRAPEIELKRYNVQYQDISNTADVLDGFYEIFSNNILEEVAGAYSYCYEQYKSFLPDDSNPFETAGSPPTSFLDNLKSAFNTIWNNSNKITIQYFYDYVNDLILAYYEFREAACRINTQCCANECAFPLHLTLGQATESTNDLVKDCWRQYFIYSPLFDNDNNSLTRLRFYFRRMEIMASATIFPITLPSTSRNIRITPSQYRSFPLSQRAIPYYYPEDPSLPDSLYRFWNFEKSKLGNATANLSYNARVYNSTNAVVYDPLDYDIERFNFFRIEGHIGLGYADVLERVTSLRRTFNLPFDVVAVSAELLDPNRVISIPPCIIQDLETDLRVLLIEFLCKLFLCIYRLTYLPFHSTLNEGIEGFAGASIDNMPLPDAAAFTNAFQFSFSTYKYGDFIANFKPAANTIGQAYVSGLSNNSFVNIVDFLFLTEVNQLISGKIYNTIFGLLNAADQLFYSLLNSKIQDFVPATFTGLRETFDKQYSVLQTLVQSADASSFVKTTGLSIDLLKRCDCLLCIAESILVVFQEYIRRVKLYESQLEFLHYYQKHPGLEHKAGVPKGGTFVLVYHQETITKPAPGMSTSVGSPAALAATADTNVIDDSRTLNELTNVLKENDSYSAEIIDRVAGLLKNFRPIHKFFTIPDGAVIADFYVPYLCCSDCSPVAYIFPGQTTTKPVFDIQPRTFLYDDAHNYPFTTQPAITQISDVTNPNNLKLLLEGTTLSLHPAMDDPEGGTGITKTLAASLSYQGIDLAITIIVPDADFTIAVSQTATTDGGSLIQIQVAAIIVDPLAAYEWSVNSNTTIFQPVSNPVAVNLDSLPRGQSALYIISLTVTYNLNNDISTDTKTTRLTGDQIKKSVGKPPFTPVFT